MGLGKEGRELLRAYTANQIQRSHHRIIKQCLRILENIRDQEYNINENTYPRLRKEFLDSINDETRYLEEAIDIDKIVFAINGR